MATKGSVVTVHRIIKQDPDVNIELATDGDLNTRWKDATSNPSPSETVNIEEAQRLINAGVVILINGKPTKYL